MHDENNYNKVELSNNFKTDFGKLDKFLPNELSYEQKQKLLENLLSANDLARFKWEKQHLNVCGLNKSDFKYFDYDDPYALDQLKKCDVCGKIVATDQYGNGECKNCGWHNNHSANKFPNSVEYPNMVSLTKARAQFAANQPFSPSFEDFVEALTKYSEMELEYNGTTFYVYLFGGKQVAFGCKDFEKRYLNLQDFIEHASINNVLLKDIWKEIKNANYMS